MTDRDHPTSAPTPGDDLLFARTPDPTPTARRRSTPDDGSPALFSENQPAKRTPRPRKTQPRWRDEDMPLRPGDVLAAGLTHHRAVVGQVTAVNDHAFRLTSYSLRLDQFNAGTIVVGWQQVVEFGPVAHKRGDHSLVMEPLLRWAENWQIR